MHLLPAKPKQQMSGGGQAGVAGAIGDRWNRCSARFRHREQRCRKTRPPKKKRTGRGGMPTRTSTCAISAINSSTGSSGYGHIKWTHQNKKTHQKEKKRALQHRQAEQVPQRTARRKHTPTHIPEPWTQLPQPRESVAETARSAPLIPVFR